MPFVEWLVHSVCVSSQIPYEEGVIMRILVIWTWSFGEKIHTRVHSWSEMSDRAGVWVQSGSSSHLITSLLKEDMQEDEVRRVMGVDNFSSQALLLFIRVISFLSLDPSSCHDVCASS